LKLLLRRTRRSRATVQSSESPVYKHPQNKILNGSSLFGGKMVDRKRDAGEGVLQHKSLSCHY
jgi:hypothetical protein